MFTSQPVRVIVRSDHELARLTLAIFFETTGGFDLEKDCQGDRKSTALCLTACPDVVMMDLNMPTMNGVAATRAITELCPAVRVVVLSSEHDEHLLPAALQAGAAGYINRDISIEELAATVRKIATRKHDAVPRTL